jgi:hypothetical protein
MSDPTHAHERLCGPAEHVEHLTEFLKAAGTIGTRLQCGNGRLCRNFVGVSCLLPVASLLRELGEAVSLTAGRLRSGLGLQPVERFALSIDCAYDIARELERSSQKSARHAGAHRIDLYWPQPQRTSARSGCLTDKRGSLCSGSAVQLDEHDRLACDVVPSLRLELLISSCLKAASSLAMVLNCRTHIAVTVARSAVP